MKLGVKYLILLLSLAGGLSACQGDVENPNAGLSEEVLAGPTHIPYAPGAATFSLTTSVNTVVAGSDVTLTVNSFDQFGNPYSAGVKTIEFNQINGTSTGSIGVIKPKGDGKFEATFTGNVAGTAVTVQAVVNGMTVNSTAQITVTTGEAKSVTVVDGNYQAARLNTQLAKNAKVKVADKYGNPILGAAVNFQVVGATPGNSTLNGATSLSENTTTDVNGIAEMPWVMGNSTGETDLLISTPITSGTVTATMVATVYDKPSTPDLYITGVNGKVDLAWTVASIGASEIRYTVYRSVNPTTGFFAVASNTQASIFSDVDATSGTFYYYVVGNNGYMNSDPSPTVTNLVSVTQIWDLITANSSNYVYDPLKIDFTNNICALTPTNQTDTATTGLPSGTHLGTALLGGKIALANAGACDSTQSDCNPDDEFSSAWFTKYANVVGYWKFNGTPASIANNATITGTVGSNGVALNAGGTGMAYVANAKLTQAAYFDGVDDSVKVTNYAAINFNSTNKYAVSFWYKPNSVAGVKYIFDKQAATGFGYFAYRNGNAVYFGFPNGTTWNELGTGAVLAVGRWYHLVATHNGTSQQVYVNGVLVATRTLTLTLANSANDLYIGRAVSGGANDNFTVDDFALFNTDLTAAEVQTIFLKQSSQRVGVYTSRVMDGLTTGTSWTKFSWVPTLPFMKALPDYAGGYQNESSTDYASLVGTTGSVLDNNLMYDIPTAKGIVGLWHLDETSGSTLADTSGAGNTNTVPVGAIGFASGRINNGVSLNGSTYISIPYKSSRNLTSAYTVQAWVYQTGNPSGYASIITDAYTSNMQFVMGYNTANGLIYGGAYQVASGWYNTAAGYALPIGAWTHLVQTYNGAQGKISLYVNGKLFSSVTGVPSTLVTNGTATHFGKSWTNHYFNGVMDEIALWNRTLSDTEVSQLYRRGGNRLKFQVRTCTAANCTDDPSGANWKGPNGKGTYFSEHYNRNVQSNNPSGGQKITAPLMTFSNFSNPAPSRRYFQYRAVLESDDNTLSCDYGSGATWCSPEFTGVTVDPVHYESSSPTVVTKNTIPFAKVLKITETLGSCPGGISYNVSLDKTTWYYWTGTVWAVANGTVAQSNSALNLMGVGAIANFTRAVGSGPVYLKAFLKSNGTNGCSISAMKLEGQ